MTATFHHFQLCVFISTSFRSISVNRFASDAVTSPDAGGDKFGTGETLQRAPKSEKWRKKMEREREREREREKEREGRDEERALKQGELMYMHVQPTSFSLSWPAAIINCHRGCNGRDGEVSSPFPLSSECLFEKQSFLYLTNSTYRYSTGRPCFHGALQIKPSPVPS